MDDQQYANDYHNMIEQEQIGPSELKIKKKIKITDEKIIDYKINPEHIQQNIKKDVIQNNHISLFQKPEDQYIQTNIKASSIREEMRSKPLRDFHNVIKSILISIYSQKQKQKLCSYYGPLGNHKLSVLDIGCGKGGDLFKWSNNQIAYYQGIDPSQSHLTEASSRFNQYKKQKNFKSFILQLKCISASDPEMHSSHSPFYDLISSQFVMQYMFESEKSANILFQNISSHLVKDGYFFCIIPDSNVLVKRLRNLGQLQNNSYEYGNSYYRVSFQNKKFPKDHKFGLQYGFYLEDAIGKRQLLSDQEYLYRFTEEFLIVDSVLQELASKNNLQIIRNQNLLDFYEAEKSNFQDQFKKLQSVTQEEWEVSSIYKVVVMQKKGGQDIDFDRNFNKYKSEIKKDIIFK